MIHLGLFEGIGGFSLAAKWMNWKTIAWCEKDEKAKEVLRKHFPEAVEHSDIFDFNTEDYENKIDIITAGFPCQPFSVAGKRKGTDDERYLWSETLRVISKIRPSWFVGENVAGLATMENSTPFDRWVQIGMESQNYFRRKYSRHIYRKRQSNVLNEIIESLIQEDYAVQTFIIPACSVGAWHRRNRIWIVAHANKNDDRRNSGSISKKKKKKRLQKRNKMGESNSTSKGRFSSNSNSKRRRSRTNNRKNAENAWQLQGSKEYRAWNSEPKVGRVANGVRGRVDRLKQLGNAIVPQVAYEIYRAIEYVQDKE